jgi:hypothetical protein
MSKRKSKGRAKSKATGKTVHKLMTNALVRAEVEAAIEDLFDHWRAGPMNKAAPATVITVLCYTLVHVVLLSTPQMSVREHVKVLSELLHKLLSQLSRSRGYQVRSE